MNKNSTFVGIVGVVVLTLMFMGAYLVLELNGRPTDGFVTTFAPMLAPTIAALLILFKQEKTQQTVEHMEAKVDTVQQQTNSHMEKQQEQTNQHMGLLVDAAIHSGAIQPTQQNDTGRVM